VKGKQYFQKIPFEKCFHCFFMDLFSPNQLHDNAGNKEIPFFDMAS
jgi:hypothetical protein